MTIGPSEDAIGTIWNGGPGHGEQDLTGSDLGVHRLRHDGLGVLAEMRLDDVLMQQGDGVARGIYPWNGGGLSRPVRSPALVHASLELQALKLSADA